MKLQPPCNCQYYLGRSFRDGHNDTFLPGFRVGDELNNIVKKVTEVCSREFLLISTYWLESCPFPWWGA